MTVQAHRCVGPADRPDRHGEACWVTWVWVLQIGAKAFIHSALTKHDRDLAGTLSINPQTQHGENPTFTPGEKVTGRPMAQDGEDTRSMNPFPCQGEIGWTHKEKPIQSSCLTQSCLPPQPWKTGLTSGITGLIKAVLAPPPIEVVNTHHYDCHE